MLPSRFSSRALFWVVSAALLAGCGGSSNPSPAGPRITTQPVSQTVALNGSVTFRVVATGSDLTYQWSRNGMAIAGATGDSYTLSSVALADVAEYRVRVASGSRATSSLAAFLSLQGAPRIVSEPTDVTGRSGTPATLTVGVEGDAPLTYQWFRNGLAIDGATSATYSIAALNAETTGTYQVTVNNAKGGAVSGFVNVTIGVARPPSITGQPESQSVSVGQTASLTVVASGTGSLTYQWRKDGVELPGQTANVLTLPNVALSDAGAYSVVVRNDEGSATSTDATLTVVEVPVITAQPQSTTVNPGQAASFTVTATGNGLAYRWTKSGTVVPNANGATLTIASVTNSDAGSYVVRVSNAAGAVTSSTATLTVRVPPSIVQQPRIVVNAGATSVTVVAAGTDIVYQWFRNGATVNGANAATYRIGTVNAGNRGVYTVSVSNAAGTVTSEGVNVQ